MVVRVRHVMEVNQMSPTNRVVLNNLQTPCHTSFTLLSQSHHCVFTRFIVSGCRAVIIKFAPLRPEVL